MRVAFDAPGDRVDLGKLGLRYTDLTGASAKRRKWDHTPSVATTGNKAASEASVDKDVAARVAEIEVATAMTRAADMAAEGRMQEAQKELKAAGARARVQAAASGGAAGKQLQVYAEEAESLADVLAAPAAAAPAERKAATKKLKAKGYGIKKR